MHASINAGVCDVAATLRRAAAEPHMMILQRGADKVAGFLALPRDPGRHRAVIAMHEWWGLNDWVKEQARNLATNGYVAFAVDLYQRNVATNPSEARKLKRGLRDELVIRAMRASFDYLADRPDVDPMHIGSIGWSMGGSYALQFAVHEPRLAACVVNYGALPTDPGVIQHIHAQVLGTFGALDRGIPPGTVRAFEQGMRAANKSVEIKIYHGAGHAFQNPDNTRGYRPGPAADAWSRTLAFLANARASHVPRSTVAERETRDSSP